MGLLQIKPRLGSKEEIWEKVTMEEKISKPITGATTIVRKEDRPEICFFSGRETTKERSQFMF